VRSLLGFASIVALLAGCSSNWTLNVQVSGERVSKPYFHDADGDGWGDGGSELRMLSGADVGAGYTARNNRDCDDADADVTGLVGAACPADLVTGDSDWVGLVGASSEYVAMIAPSATVWPDEAALACALGWGDSGERAPADLASFDSISEASDLAAALSAANVGDYAGFIGLQYHQGSGWAWIDGSDLAPSSIGDGWCDPNLASEPQAEGQLAALVHDGARWCVGLPSTVSTAHPGIPGGSASIYADLYAHFICKRATPDPYNFRVPPPDQAAGG